MSDQNKIVDPIFVDIEKKAAAATELSAKKEVVLQKELKVKERRLDNELEKMEQRDKDTEIAKKTSYGVMSEEEVRKMQEETADYMLSARNKLRFINESFDKAIPFFRKNLILIGGKTGEGKSTTVANIIRETIRKTDPATGKKRRILVLTNEEKREDVYNRVTCLIKGWHYTNHDKFTDEQVETFKYYQGVLAKDGMMTVVDDNHGGAGGTTTTLDGICTVFDNLLEAKEFYDVVILDYYQNVKESRKFPSMNEWEVQAALAGKLDRYKNVYPAPIVVLAQVQPPDAENKTPFKTRIEGRKVILNVCTCCLEMVANREELTTEWWIHKSRFNEAVGQKITTGYSKGQYVLWDEEFRNMVGRLKAAQQVEELNKASGMTAPKAKEEEVVK